jgi:hypothetical protein
MRKRVVLGVLAGTLAFGLGSGRRTSLVAADDPPPLEPPVASDPSQRRPEPPERFPGLDPKARPSPGIVHGTPATPRADVRRDGPPRETPEDTPGPPPGPNFFYVPGQHVPAGAGLTWRPGFWARLQPGWEWVPARWVRLAGGWTYREGHWERVPDETAAPPRDPRPTPGPSIVSEPETTRRHAVARPSLAPGSTGPFSANANTPAPERPDDPNPATDLAPLPEGTLAPLPEPGPPTTPGPPPQPDPGSVPNPDQNPGPLPAPNIPWAPLPGPRVVGPGFSVSLPVTELNLPGGLYIRVVPGQIPYVGSVPPPYPGGVVTRPLPPRQGVRERFRDLMGVPR